MSTLHRPALTRWALAPVLVALAVSAAGCGSSDGSPRVATLRSQGASASEAANGGRDDPETAARKFAQCMRKNGVDMPDPKVQKDGSVVQEGPAGQRSGPPPGQPPPSGPPDGGEGDVVPRTGPGEKFARAEKACSKFLGHANVGGSPEDQTRMQDAILKYARCMRANGYNMPDPDFSKGLSSARIPVEDTPTFKKADAACKEKLGAVAGPGNHP